jgi:SAM-dependent methyltransferase
VDYAALLAPIIDVHRVSPIVMLGTGTGRAEHAYLRIHLKSYVRTLRDVDGWLRRTQGKRVLEIGSFLGAVSIGLRRLGYEVSALDIPEFHANERLRRLYEREGIPFAGVNLRHGRLPYESGSFDAVLLCETLEHLNFNPLPTLLEMNRVLADGGLLYVGMPNQAHLVNRLALLRGRSIRNPVRDLFAQLDRAANMVVGIHWREYTLSETRELLERLGFATERAYYFADRTGAGWKEVIAQAVYAVVPSLRPFLVVMATKRTRPAFDFWLTEANS